MKLMTMKTQVQAKNVYKQKLAEEPCITEHTVLCEKELIQGKYFSKK